MEIRVGVPGIRRARSTRDPVRPRRPGRQFGHMSRPTSTSWFVSVLVARRTALVDDAEQSPMQALFRGLATHKVARTTSRYVQQSLTLLSLSAAPPQRQATGGPEQHLLVTVLPTNAVSQRRQPVPYVPRAAVKTVTGRGQQDWIARPTDDNLCKWLRHFYERRCRTRTPRDGRVACPRQVAGWHSSGQSRPTCCQLARLHQVRVPARLTMLPVNGRMGLVKPRALQTIAAVKPIALAVTLALLPTTPPTARSAPHSPGAVQSARR